MCKIGGANEKIPKSSEGSQLTFKASQKEMEMLNKQVTVTLLTTFVIGVGGVGYSWADWVTKTLIAVDKRTEVMASQIDFIKTQMEIRYGDVQGTNETASFEAASKN